MVFRKKIRLIESEYLMPLPRIKAFKQKYGFLLSMCEFKSGNCDYRATTALV